MQRTAVAVIKLRAAQNRHGQNRQTQAATPSLAVAAHLAERGKTEQATRETIREELNAQRQLNHIRAAAPAQRRHAPGRMAERRAANRTEIQAQRQARQQSDQHSALRQAVSSGRPPTSAELANAPPEVKAAIALHGNRDRSRREDAFLRFVSRQRSDKGRNGNGGRSGR